MIGARIDRLPPDRRARLRDLSVFGREVPRVLVDAVVGRDPEPGRGLGAFVTVDRDGLHFRHELVREVAYEGLSFRRRRELHAKAVRVLAHAGGDPLTGDRIAALAFHAAGSGEPALAWRWCRRGGDAALAGGAFGDALRHYDAALEAAKTASPGVRPRLDTWERCGDAADRAGRHDRAASAYRRARALAVDDPRTRALLASKLGVLAERAGRFGAARRWYRTGLREVATAPKGPATDLATARLLLDLGSACQYEGRLELAARHAREAAALAERRRDRALAGQAEMQLEMVFGALGDPESEVHFVRAERALRARATTRVSPRSISAVASPRTTRAIGTSPRPATRRRSAHSNAAVIPAPARRPATTRRCCCSIAAATPRPGRSSSRSGAISRVWASSSAPRSPR